ncbi:MAG: PIG-L family deacetylase [Desulfobacterales bacterium]|nr:PIG-L family deacetylase [Desulfobacterales bacterium]
MVIMGNIHKPTVLAIGGHPDDVELGSGGLLSRFVTDYEAEVHIAIMTYGTHHWRRGRIFEEDQRAREALEAVKLLLEITDDSKAREHLHLGGFKDCELSKTGHAAIAFIEDVIDVVKPDIILTHAGCDLHDDHRQTYYASLSAARDFHGTILLYQTASTVPDHFAPTFFVQLREEELDKKIRMLDTHVSQREKDFLSHEQVAKMAEAWAGFHRMNNGAKLEPFAIYQSFWQ